MATFKSPNGFSWVVGAVRENLSRRRIREVIQAKCAEYRSDWVSISQLKGEIQVSFSRFEGQDWGKTVQSQAKSKNYIYVESIYNGFLLCHIYQGSLEEDRFYKTEEELVTTLEAIVSNVKRRGKGDYKIDTFNIQGFKNIRCILNEVEENALTDLSASFMGLPYISGLQLMKKEEAFRNLSDRKLQITLAVIVVGIVGAYVAWDYFKAPELQEVIVTKNPYQEMTNMLITGQSASVRLAQDYVNLRKLESTLSGWSVVETEYSFEGIYYHVLADEYFNPSLQSLYAYAAAYGYKVKNDKGALSLLATTPRVSPFENVEDVRTWSVNAVVTNIIDVGQNMSPFFKIRLDQLNNYESFAEHKVVAEFQMASDLDLMRLAATLDGYPLRYPIIIDSGEYKIDDAGYINGNIIFKVVGDIPPAG